MSVLLAASAPSPLWYVDRATGVLSLVLVTASVVLGILTTVRAAGASWPRFVIAALHRNVSLLVLVFLGLHILTAELDTFTSIGWLAVVVPFVSGYRPLWLGLGTVASDLLLAVVVTSLVRRQLGHRSWRAIHWLVYACWPTAVLHGLGTGTDTRLPVVLLLTLLCVAAVVGALWWRLAVGWPQHLAVRAVSGFASVVLPVALGVWVLAGPLQPGWARRAGTPAALTAVQHMAASSTSAHPAATGPPSIDAAISGTITQSGPDVSGVTTVTIRATAPTAGGEMISIILRGAADASGGVSMTDGSVALGPPGQERQYAGPVTALDGGRVQALLHGRGGSVRADVRLQIDGSSVTGRLQAAPVPAGQGG